MKQFTPDELQECADALDLMLPEHTPRKKREWPTKQLRAGFIYFIGPESGPVKIGFTNNLKLRLMRLQMGSPVKLSILAHKRGDTSDERFYHLLYMHSRLHGEWFERCPQIEAEIERLRKAHP